jgi:hypothetical protein
MNRSTVPRLTCLTSLEFCRLFVFCKLENRVEMQNLFDESGLQTHPLNFLTRSVLPPPAPAAARAQCGEPQHPTSHQR